MKKSVRALIGLVLLDAIIIGGAWWMIGQTQSGAWHSTDPAESIRLVTTVAGAMVGIVTAVLLLAFFRHRGAGN